MDKKHIKNIRRIITKQLKKNYPDWKGLTKATKKEVTKKVMNEVVGNYDYSQELDMPIEELIGIEAQEPSDGIRNLPEMSEYIENFHSENLFHFDDLKKPYSEIEDPELQFIDQLLDDQIINSLISPENYSASHRNIQPYQLFRMELLKVIKYPEISYRKFCTDEYFGRERKQNRRFVRLPLNTKDQVDHTELCHFRIGLGFRQLMNILVYFLYHFYKSGCLENTVIHGVDSSELAAEIKYPLCTIKVKDQKIRIYSYLDFDNGHFQPMPTCHNGSQEAIDIRKNCERPFNLMKKREGLEQTRVRSQHGVVVRSTFTTIVTLLIEMAGTRRKPKKKDDGQMDLFAATG